MREGWRKIVMRGITRRKLWKERKGRERNKLWREGG